MAKAYRQLEQEHLVTGRPGHGTFVNDTLPMAVPPATYTSLRHGLQAWLRRAYAAGLDDRAIAALFTSVHHQSKTKMETA